MIALFGSGPMAAEYTKVLDKLDKDYKILGNSTSSSKKFSQQLKKEVQPHGLQYFAANRNNFDAAIIAIPIEKQFKLTKSIIELKVPNILVEKPGCLHCEELQELDKLSKKNNTSVFIAYNRRQYSTVALMKKRIIEDGGITSCFFEFTEISDKVGLLDKPDCILNNWLLCNSTHVLDLFVHICGYPTELYAQSSGETQWHKPAVFTGSGITELGVPYSYIANWNSAGSWKLEVSTVKAKYILAPLEKLRVQNRNSFEINEVVDSVSINQELKPGLFNMVDAFLSGKDKDLCSLSEQIRNINFYTNLSN